MNPTKTKRQYGQWKEEDIENATKLYLEGKCGEGTIFPNQHLKHTCCLKILGFCSFREIMIDIGYERRSGYSKSIWNLQLWCEGLNKRTNL